MDNLVKHYAVLLQVLLSFMLASPCRKTINNHIINLISDYSKVLEKDFNIQTLLTVTKVIFLDKPKLLLVAKYSSLVYSLVNYLTTSKENKYF